MAFAELSIIEIAVKPYDPDGEDQVYQLRLHEGDNRQDQVLRKRGDREWVSLYEGPVTSFRVPQDAKVVQNSAGYRTQAGLTPLVFSKERLFHNKTEVELRLRSGEDKLVLITPYGAPQVPWPGEVIEAVQFGRQVNLSQGISVLIFSVRGLQSSGTYIVLNDDFNHPHLIRRSFLGKDPKAWIKSNGKIRLEALNIEFNPDVLNASLARMETVASLLQQPPDDVVLDELVLLFLDRRPVMDAVVNAPELLGKVIRRTILGEFPYLGTLAAANLKVSDDLNKLVGALVHLWFARKKINGPMIRDVVIQRLEAFVENRAQCELSLLSLSGPGAQADFYYRGEALRALNRLHRALNHPVSGG